MVYVGRWMRITAFALGVLGAVSRYFVRDRKTQRVRDNLRVGLRCNALRPGHPMPAPLAKVAFKVVLSASATTFAEPRRAKTVNGAVVVPLDDQIRYQI